LGRVPPWLTTAAPGEPGHLDDSAASGIKVTGVDSVSSAHQDREG
jgi:hypothetical protein